MKITEGKLDDKSNYLIPDNQKYIKIDVGLAGEAPNSAIWLSETTDRFVIGVEPLAYHWKMIKNFESSNSKRPYPYNFPIVQLEEGVVKLNKQNICEINDRFIGIECAIDNVSEPTTRTFYQMDRTGGASGSSSLLKPTSSHPHFIEEEMTVPVLSLESILDHVDWVRFPFIEHIKVDCEGHDLEVVKSIGKYLDKIVFITVEMSNSNSGHWEDSTKHEDVYSFMSDNNFAKAEMMGADITFINKELVPVADSHNLGCKVLGL